MRTIISLSIINFIVLALWIPFNGCEQTPNDPVIPAEETGIYALTVSTDRDTAWTGHSLYATVTPEVPLPPDCRYRWLVYTNYPYDYYGFDTTASTVEIPMAKAGTIIITARVMNKTGYEKSYSQGRTKVHVLHFSGRLLITPDTAFWDRDRALEFSAVYEGPLPEHSHILWEFGDGSTQTAQITESVDHTFDRPGEYATRASLINTDNDSVVSIGTGVITVSAPTPGRFLSVTIAGLERTFMRGRKYYDTYVVNDTIRTGTTDYLQWNGNNFLSEKIRIREVPGATIWKCLGAMDGDRIDSLRIECTIGWATYQGYIRSISFLLRDIARSESSDAVWEVAGTACSSSLVEYVESRSVIAGYDKLRMPITRSDHLASTELLRNARITMSISHSK